MTHIGIEDRMCPHSFQCYHLILGFSWTGHFEDVRLTQPGPEPGCKPPPAEGAYSYQCQRCSKPDALFL